MIKAPITSSGNIYNSGGKETLSYHVKVYRIFELDVYSYNWNTQHLSANFYFLHLWPAQNPKPILE